jgi:sec-independent protein translocase protein TatA
MELIVVLVIALIVLGPKKLPDVGRSLGKGLREFKDSVSGLTDGHDDDEPIRQEVRAQATEPAAKVEPAEAAEPKRETVA